MLCNRIDDVAIWRAVWYGEQTVITERDPRQLPDWAQRERERDFQWIGENLHIFVPAARAGFMKSGRGALLVDITLTIQDNGHPFAYFPQAAIERGDDENIQRMVREYDPAQELVVSLLKTADRTSTYRVRAVPRQLSSNQSHPFSLS